MTSLVTLVGDDADTAPTNGVPEAAWSFELLREVEILRNGPQYLTTGHAARTLFKSPALRIVLIVLERDAELKEHKMVEPATVQVLEGEIRISLPRRQVESAAGGLVVIEPGVRHEVVALADSALVLSMPWADHAS